jgi:cytochrome bd-type quinol oxidase subunit 1
MASTQSVFPQKAEQIFLTDDDYGRLLPKKYKTPKKGWITFYKINMITFLLFLILTLLYAVFWKLCSGRFFEDWLLPIEVLLIGIPLTWVNMRQQERSSKQNYKELFEDNASSN